MLGFFRKKEAEVPSLATDKSGRAIPPDLHFSAPDDATEADIVQALRWAHAWCRSDGPFDLSAAREALDSMNEAKRVKDKGLAKVVLAARRLIDSTSHRNRSARVRAAFPYFLLRLTEGADACEQASEKAGRYLTGPLPKLPLQDCTCEECRCSIRIVTAKEGSQALDGKETL